MVKHIAELIGYEIVGSNPTRHPKYENKYKRLNNMITGKLYEPCDNSYCVNLATGKGAFIVQNVNAFYQPDENGPFRIISEPYNQKVTTFVNDCIHTFINVKSESTGNTYRTLYQEDRVINQEPTEIKIIVPEGMEIDEENSTFECIKFKPKSLPTYEEISKHLFKHKSANWIAYNGISTIDHYNSCNYNDGNLMLSRKQAEKILALNKLFNIAQYLNSTTDNCEGKFVLLLEDDGNTVDICDTMYDNAYGLPTFNTIELAKQAIEILGKDTIKLALSKL